MAAPTPRVALTRDDPGDNYNVGRVNANSDKLDETIGAAHCTSGGRPTTGLFNGRLAYETDTKALIEYTVSGGVWTYLTPAHVGSKSAQDALTPKHDGLRVWRTDRDWMAVWTGSTWFVPGVATVANTADRDAELVSPIQGQLVFITDWGLEMVRWAGSWTYSPKRIGGEWQANANKSIGVGVNKLQFQTSLHNYGITVISNDGFQVPNDGIYAMTTFFKFSFATRPSSASMDISGISHATPMYSGDQFGELPTDLRASATCWLNSGDVVCAYIYSNAGGASSDIAVRPHKFSLWRVG